jgi:GNAT superfamily N-acetyltransferase
LTVKISLLKASDIPLVMSAFKKSEWKTPESYFQRLLDTQRKGDIVFLIARFDSAIAGFLYIKWQADYPPFEEQTIPEIRDLRVLAKFRRKGVATALMDEAEKRIFARYPVVGISVGLYADYGAAQSMYVLRGYVPDGRGLMCHNLPVNPGHDVFVDDDLLLYFTKERR